MSRVVMVFLCVVGLIVATMATSADSHYDVKKVNPEVTDSEVKKVDSDVAKSSSDFESSVSDYKQYSQSWTKSIPVNISRVMDFHQYIPDYSKYVPGNISKMDFDQYIPKFEQYQDVDKYIRFAKFMGRNSTPSSAEECNTTAQLDAWRMRMEAPLKAFIPKEFRTLSISPIEETYEENLKRIEDAKKEEGAEKKQVLSDDSVDAGGFMFLAASLGDVVRSKSASDTKAKVTVPDFAHFVPNSSQYIPDWKQYVPTNVSGFDYDKLIPDYEKYMDIKKYLAFADASTKDDGPSKASKCTSMKELDAWRKAVAGPADAFIPKMWRSFTTDSINDEYDRNKKRIAAEEAKTGQELDGTTVANLSRRLSASSSESAARSNESRYDNFIPSYAKYQDVQKYMKFAKLMQHTKAPDSAADCQTKEELDAWRAAREAPIKAFVPKRWQDLESIKQRYSTNLERIEERQAQAKQTETVAIAVPMELRVDDGFSPGAKQFTPIRIQIPEVQDLVPSYAKHLDMHLFLSFATFIRENGAPEKAEDCKTVKELNAWRQKQASIIKEFMPQAYQSFPAHALENKYEESKRRIEASDETAQKIQTSYVQFASMVNGVGIPLVAFVAFKFSVASAASSSWRLRRESTLQEHLLDPEAPLAA